MGVIHFLPEDIISKIAAGEVIERPLFVVKELIDNSIDAKATSITIHIEQGGMKRITVIDDGVGMSRQDCLLSFKRHATSKVFTTDDLHQIKTMGFRGEALSAIAAVSKLTILSRIQNEPGGTLVEIKGDSVSSLPSASAVGTTVTVSDLFSSVPARKQFIKSTKTEFRHIVQVVINYALSYPHIQFTLTNNGKVVFDLPRQSDRIERIKTLLGFNLYEQLLPVNLKDSYVTIEGFVAKPQLATLSSLKQYLFVNNRQVSDKLISQAVKDSFGSLLEPIAQPIYILFLTMPFEIVDVNVHPRKEQVSFVNNQMVYDLVKEAVSQTLLNNNLTFQNVNWILENTQKIKNPGNTNSIAANMIKDAVAPWLVKDRAHVLDSSNVFQIHNTYLITQTKHGLLLIDQHAAHERILFEQFKQEFKKQKQLLQPFILQSAIPLELAVDEILLLNENNDYLKQFGFELDYLKDTSLIIRAIPFIFKDRNVEELLLEILDDLKNGSKIKDVDTLSLKMLEFLACRAAIKAGDVLTQSEAKNLIEQLEKVENQFTCPHGRPTKIEMDIKNLHKAFKRL